MTMTMRTAVHPLQSYDLGLLELQPDELAQTIAVEAISTAMRAAWFGRLVMCWYRSGTEQYLPPAGEIFTVPSTELLQCARRRGACDAYLSSSAVFGILKFYSELSDLECDCVSPSPRSAPVARVLKTKNNVSLEQWQRVAAVGVQMLDELRHCIGHLLPKPIGDILTAVNAELVLARDPDDLSSSAASIRAGRENNQRRMKRYTLNSPALLRCAGESRNIVVVDISIGGLGLKNIGNLKRGSYVTVWLKNRREFSGTISWIRDQRAGMIFDTPLPSNDSLFGRLR
jgi:hypothetical protein